MRLEETSLIRRMLLATVERDLEAGNRHAGGLLMDAPAFMSVEQLLEMAGDRRLKADPPYASNVKLRGLKPGAERRKI